MEIEWRTSLDSRIGVVHAANRRHYSLNLDFADIFKPIIVDRVIFTLINKGMIDGDCFVTNHDGSVYLSGRGKKLFIESFQTKMYSKLKLDGKQFTYNQIIEREVMNYQAYIQEGKRYHPYKYYYLFRRNDYVDRIIKSRSVSSCFFTFYENGFFRSFSSVRENRLTDFWA